MTETNHESRPSWPLFVVAGLSFVPVLGIFFGGAGATWGFVSSRRRAILAALIAMAGALLQIIGLLVWSVLTIDKTGGMTDTRKRMIQMEMLKVVEAADAYRAKEQRYPETLLELRRSYGGFPGLLISDGTAGFASQQPLQYRVAADGQSFDLFAVGADKLPGTADDLRPIIPDSLKGRTGFRADTSGVHR